MSKTDLKKHGLLIIKVLMVVIPGLLVWYTTIETRFTALAGEDKRIEQKIDAQMVFMNQNVSDIKGSLIRIEDKIDRKVDK